MPDNNPKFIGKIFIKGKIVVKTGLHIGGSKTALDIGGIDLNVIKTAKGDIPFIPGSSFKGKLRTLLGREEGSRSDREDTPEIKEVFGFPAEENDDDENSNFIPTRLIIRDAYLLDKEFENTFKNAELETRYTESKWENTINRLSGTALHPRQLERVPAGAAFKFEMVYDKYDDNKVENHMEMITLAMRLLEDDYLGGHGSRGYGKICFHEVVFEQRNLEDYRSGAGRSILTEKPYQFESSCS